MDFFVGNSYVEEVGNRVYQRFYLKYYPGTTRSVDLLASPRAEDFISFLTVPKAKFKTKVRKNYKTLSLNYIFFSLSLAQI